MDFVMHLNTEILAFIASMIGVSGSLPQIFKILRTRETKALSYGQYMLVILSCSLWVFYGFVILVYSIAIWNSLALVTSMTVVAMKYKNEKEPRSSSAARLAKEQGSVFSEPLRIQVPLRRRRKRGVLLHSYH